MTPQDNFDRTTLLKIVGQNIALHSPVNDVINKTLSELGIDSLNLISLSVAFEDSCKLRIDIDHLTEESTLDDLLNNLKPI